MLANNSLELLDGSEGPHSGELSGNGGSWCCRHGHCRGLSCSAGGQSVGREAAAARVAWEVLEGRGRTATRGSAAPAAAARSQSAGREALAPGRRPRRRSRGQSADGFLEAGAWGEGGSGPVPGPAAWPRGLAAFGNLRSLGLSNNRLAHLEAVAPVAFLPHLTVLVLEVFNCAPKSECTIRGWGGVWRRSPALSRSRCYICKVLAFDIRLWNDVFALHSCPPPPLPPHLWNGF